MGTLSLLLMGIGGIGCAFSPPINPSADFEWYDIFPAVFFAGCITALVWLGQGLAKAWGLV